ncbi:MAG: TlpA disulfide reductase family protein [Sphingobium sp.]
MKAWFGGLALAALLSAGPARAEPPKVGEPAGDFTLTMLDGSKLSFAELKGNVIVLNFWATWCVPCREELPLLDGYYGLQKQHGLRVIAIETQSGSSVPMYRLKSILAKLTMPSARRIKGPYETLKGVPTNYVIDRAGIVRYAKAGAFNLDSLNRILVPLLKEPPPQAR